MLHCRIVKYFDFSGVHSFPKFKDDLFSQTSMSVGPIPVKTERRVQIKLTTTRVLVQQDILAETVRQVSIYTSVTISKRITLPDCKVLRLIQSRIYLYIKIVLLLADINKCEPNSCKNEGTCTDKVNNYTCSCVAGYTGRDCQIGEYL